jgi:hypothetical protein
MSDVQDIRRRAGSAAAPAERFRAGGLTVSAWAGIIGPALFAAIFLGLEVVHGAEYDRVAEVVSALEAGR